MNNIPHNYYPRKTLVRDSFISLNGEWDFAYSETPVSEYNEKITVPFPPESKLSGIERTHKKSEKLYYRKYFKVPDGFIKNRLILRFGACDQIASVSLNGTHLGTHEGGYTPFSFDITDFISEGENELTVVAEDELLKKYPYGKQKEKRGGMWYTPVSGIWQTVWLESLPERPIESLKITTNMKEARISVKTEAESLTLTLLDCNEMFTSTSGEFLISPKNPKLWTPDTPYLYRFRLESETDSIESYFALREIGTVKENNVTRLSLNGKAYLFNGLLDQGYYQDGIYLPESIDGYINDIKGAKELGFNTLRKHIKLEPEVFYSLCDELGMVVFQDMINNSDYSFFRDTALPTVFMKRFPDRLLHRNKEERRIFIDTMREVIEILYNHPSVLYYTIFNEGWGQFSADEVYTLAKSLDETRIFDATSGWFQRSKSDVDSHHIYFKKLKAKINPDLPCVISEFGGYSYRCEGHLFGDGNYGYRTFKNQKDFEDAFVSLYENEVLPLVDRGVSVLVYTQISDVEDETNGLFTYDREICKLNRELCAKTMKKLWRFSEK